MKIAFAVKELKSLSCSPFYEIGAELVRLFGHQIEFVPACLWHKPDVFKPFDGVVVTSHDFPAKAARRKVAWISYSRDLWQDSYEAVLTTFQTHDDEYLPYASGRAFLSASGDQKYRCDYCVVCAPDDILERCIDPYNVNRNARLYGTGWDSIKHLKPYHRGQVAYEEMPSLFASTKMVIESSDTAHASSTIYNAIAAGAIPVTNNFTVSLTIFNGLLPVFRDKAELKQIIAYYTHNEFRRNEKVEQLRSQIKRDTYEHRATRLESVFKRVSS